MRSPRIFTFIIQSYQRTSGTAADYYVNIPQIDALANGGDRPDYYELYLDRICGTIVTTNESVTTDVTGFVQLAIDLPAPYLYEATNISNIKFVVPVQSVANGYMLDQNARTMNPIIISASGLSSMLHIQLYNDTTNAPTNIASLITPGTHEHIIVLTLKERF